MKASAAKTLILSLALVGSSLAWRQANSQQADGNTKADTMDKSAAATYENLATAIIAIEATEDELVRSILLGYQAAAQGHLRAAAEPGPNRKAHLEAAATTIGDIANEGDKRIQAVRQRLAKAGHTHNTDVVTKEDYMLINSNEKKEILALAQKVGKLEAGVSPDGVRAISEELSSLFDKAIAPE
ncbi:hypothetical protein P12x_002195 [Tundrisphaera lichenicola]|uniref:hypothetical protein n=1 Tax=Tundrisphaera lichenicola TaxID=2029860 RepID=UPI003EC0D825